MKKKLLRGSLYIMLLAILSAFMFSSNPKITAEDKKYIATFLKEWQLQSTSFEVHQDFESEYAFISRVQDSVLSQIAHDSVSVDGIGSIKKYYKIRKGLCFDRAIMLEKFFRTYGFSVRHAYVYFKPDNSIPAGSDFFKKGLYSHALFEVKTKKGWMAVGTNCNWLGIQKNGELMTLVGLRQKLKTGSLNFLKNITYGTPFFIDFPHKERFNIVYGVYSRHGNFFKSGFAESFLNWCGVRTHIPDYNLGMLLANL